MHVLNLSGIAFNAGKLCGGYVFKFLNLLYVHIAHAGRALWSAHFCCRAGCRHDSADNTEELGCHATSRERAGIVNPEAMTCQAQSHATGHAASYGAMYIKLYTYVTHVLYGFV